MNACKAILCVDNLSIRHEGQTVSRPQHVSVEVLAGRALLVLGPSGCGKSTFLFALNGLIPHAIPATCQGRVQVAGKDVAQTRVADLLGDIAVVLQDPSAQIVTETVFDEVCFALENMCLSVPEIEHRATIALEEVGLLHMRSYNPDTLSGGQQQRLAIACALAMGAKVLVLDEPTAYLDPVGSQEVYASLREFLQADPRRSIVFVEHHLDEALELADDVLVFDAQGQVVITGPIELVLREHAAMLNQMGVRLPCAVELSLRIADQIQQPFDIALTMQEISTRITRQFGRLSVSARNPQPHCLEEPEPLRGSDGVRVEGLEVARQGRPVLNHLNMQVARGDFLALLGLNGSGKTTLLHSLAGLIRVQPGTIHIGNMDIAHANPKELLSLIGYVLQNPEHQFITAQVDDEIAYSLRRQNADANRIARRTNELLEMLDLGDLRHEHPFLLSGGQKRRLSVATALIMEPKYLFLDEPTFGQDEKNIQALLKVLLHLNTEGTTIIMVTHDLDLTAKCAKTIALLEQGSILAQGPTEHILQNAHLMTSAGLKQPMIASWSEHFAPGALCVQDVVNALRCLA